MESGLYCELTDKTLHDGYIEYTLLYDMIANRITIDEVRAENGCLRLMKNLVWEYDALPHALIAGGTGGGKTYFLLTLIEALLHTNAVLYILDPKNADLADLGTVMPNVFHQPKTTVLCPYFINGNAVCYHIIKQDIFDISVMQGLVGQLTIQATFQFIL